MGALPLGVPRQVGPQVAESPVALAVPGRASLVERRLGALTLLLLEDPLAAESQVGLGAKAAVPLEEPQLAK